MLNTRYPEIEEILERAWQFIKANRSEKAFKYWSEDEVKNTFREAIYLKSFVMCSCPNGKVIGVVHGIADSKKHLFHVSNILTTHHSALRSLVLAFDSLWPNYSLAGDRYGKLKQYDTLKFKRKVLKNV